MPYGMVSAGYACALLELAVSKRADTVSITKLGAVKFCGLSENREAGFDRFETVGQCLPKFTFQRCPLLLGKRKEG